MKTLLRLSVALLGALSARTAAFVHPGVFNNQFELDYIKAQVNAGTQPWKNAFDNLKTFPEASLSFKPAPRASVDCGSGSNPDYGCSDENASSLAAYAHALQWVVTGDERYAQKAVEILNAWSAVLKTHGLSNAPLQAGWNGGPFVRAAEIMRYTYPKWGKANIDAFTTMFTQAFISLIYNGGTENGNWEAVMIETMLAFGVFSDNQALFDHATAMFKTLLPQYIYAGADGPMPVSPDSSWTKAQLISRWYGQSVFMDGLSQETCRDFEHTQWGIGGLIDAAEIAWKQGIDLYAERGNRLLAGMEFHARYLNGTTVPSNLCGGKLSSVSFLPMWEIGYDHYHTWMKISMPQTEALLAKNRPEGTSKHLMFGTLTHYGLGASGEPNPVAIFDGGRGNGQSQGSGKDAARQAPFITRDAFVYDLRGREIAWPKNEEKVRDLLFLRRKGVTPERAE